MQQANGVLATASAIETAAAVRTDTVSALETTEAASARIEALDGPINAVIVRDFDCVREQAKLVDAAAAKGATLPLAGVPMTVEEVFNVAGLPTTFGLEFAKTYRPTYQSDNPVYGRTNNPHSLAYSPGGSSGGSAAVLAAAEGCGAPVVIGVMSTGGWR